MKWKPDNDGWMCCTDDECEESATAIVVDDNDGWVGGFAACDDPSHRSEVMAYATSEAVEVNHEGS